MMEIYLKRFRRLHRKEKRYFRKACNFRALAARFTILAERAEGARQAYSKMAETLAGVIDAYSVEA